MNKGVTLLIALLVGSTASAQITYEHTHYATIGDSVMMSSSALAGLDPGDAGENITWDFSNLEAISQVLSKYVDPATAGYKESWCFLNFKFFDCDPAFAAISNLAQADPDTMSLEGTAVSNVVDHYLITEDGLDYSMFGFTIGSADGAIPVGQQYENYDRRIPFPMTFGTTDTSDANYVLDGNAFGFPLVQKFSLHRESEVDGYGTISTPFGDFDDVLRLRSVANRIDSIITETDTTALPTNNVTYQWFSTDFGQPLMTITALLTDSGEFVSGVEYIDSLRCLEPIADFFATPQTAVADSATQTAEVNFFNFSSNETSFVWDFGDSTGSGAKNPSHVYGAGEFTVTLIVNNEVCAPTQADTLSAVVTIHPFVAAGVEEELIKDLLIFPNPVGAGGMLQISANWKGDYAIYNFSGSQVRSGNMNGSAVIDMTDLPNSTYHLVLTSDGMVPFVHTIVK